MNAAQKIIENLLQYLAQRDLTKLISLFAENVDWYIPGDTSKAAWLGKRNTSKEIKEFYELLWGNTEPVDANITNIFSDNNIAVITGEFSTKMLQTGKTVKSLFCIEITVLDDLIVKYRLLEDSYAVSQALS